MAWAFKNRRGEIIEKSKTIAFWLILLSAFYLRWKNLAFQSYWFDELITVWQSDPDISPAVVIDRILWDVHPPMFFIFQHIWYSIFGVTEFISRMPSVLFGTMGVAGVYFLGKELFNKNVGLLASMITSLNIFHIYYSQETRAYAMLFFLTTLSILFFLRALKEPNSKNTILFSLISLCMIYTHYFALVVLFSQAVIFVFFLVSARKERHSLIQCALLATALIGVLSSPLFPFILKHAKMDEFWIPKPEPLFFTNLFKTYIRQPNLIFLFLLLLFSAMAFMFRPCGKSERSPVILLFSFIFLVYAIAYIRSVTSASVITPRNTIVVLPAFFILFALPVERMKNNFMKAAMVLSIICLSLYHLFFEANYYEKVTKNRWRNLSWNLVGINDSLPILTLDIWPGLLDVYFKRHGSPLRGGNFSDRAEQLDRQPHFWLVARDTGKLDAKIEQMNLRVEVYLKIDGISAAKCSRKPLESGGSQH